MAVCKGKEDCPPYEYCSEVVNYRCETCQLACRDPGTAECQTKCPEMLIDTTTLPTTTTTTLTPNTSSSSETLPTEIIAVIFICTCILGIMVICFLVAILYKRRMNKPNQSQDEEINTTMQHFVRCQGLEVGGRGSEVETMLFADDVEPRSLLRFYRAKTPSNLSSYSMIESVALSEVDMTQIRSESSVISDDENSESVQLRNSHGVDIISRERNNMHKSLSQLFDLSSQGTNSQSDVRQMVTGEKEKHFRGKSNRNNNLFPKFESENDLECRIGMNNKDRQRVGGSCRFSETCETNCDELDKCKRRTDSTIPKPERGNDSVNRAITGQHSGISTSKVYGAEVLSNRETGYHGDVRQCVTGGTGTNNEKHENGKASKYRIDTNSEDSQQVGGAYFDNTDDTSGRTTRQKRQECRDNNDKISGTEKRAIAGHTEPCASGHKHANREQTKSNDSRNPTHRIPDIYRKSKPYETSDNATLESSKCEDIRDDSLVPSEPTFQLDLYASEFVEKEEPCVYGSQVLVPVDDDITSGGISLDESRGENGEQIRGSGEDDKLIPAVTRQDVEPLNLRFEQDQISRCAEPRSVKENVKKDTQEPVSRAFPENMVVLKGLEPQENTQPTVAMSEGTLPKERPPFNIRYQGTVLEKAECSPCVSERREDGEQSLAFPQQVSDGNQAIQTEDEEVKEFERMFPGFIHPSKQRNRWIYDQLKKVDWVMGYYSAGESIEVYVNLGSLDPHVVEQQLADITGADISKFHAKQNEEPIYDYDL